MMSLGPFELTDPIGRGGMGEVWAARHHVDRRPVAIKVITDSRALQDRFQAAFRNEARAMAGMEHPGIARILDFGRVAGSSLDGVRDGSPYLVMERLGRPLDVRRARGWSRVGAVLLALLDALAHAHARGLVHRDLKPDNILWSTDGRALKLTDFGVAHAIHGATPRDAARRDAQRTWETAGAAESGMVGTPDYMAPEQVRGEVWAHGPWTDLYALGCLAFELVSGRAPFGEAGRPLATMMAHMTEAVPALRPRFPVPPAFEGWVGKLLTKSPEGRFRKAADAAWALRSMHDPPDAAPQSFGSLPGSMAGSLADPFADASWPGLPGSAADDARLHPPPSFGSLGGLLPGIDPAALTDHTIVDSRPPTFVDVGDGLLETGPLPVLASPSGVPPMPDDWRAPAGARATAAMAGVGLGLFGLRRVPFVGRHTERDLLWSLLGLVADRGAAQVAVLRGPSGFGKTRLAEWLVERADELGAASGLRAMHGAVPGPGQGLTGMLERALRCVQVEPDALRAHVTRMLATLGVDTPEEVDALVRLVDPGGGARPTRAVRPEEQYAIVRRHLERLAAERPLVVVLDDAHYNRHALDFCAHVLDAQARWPSPILLVLTVRDEDLPRRPDAVERLAALDARDAVRIEVGPLAPDDRPALLDALLGLQPDLLRRIDARTGGNALFAVQLVGDWVRRGVLEAAPDGFTLAADAGTTLPDDLGAVWQARIEQLLTERAGLDRAGSDARALELAATLGLQIDGGEWRAVCTAAGLPADPGLVEALLDAALARCGPEGPAQRWAFAHGMLREAILKRARDAGRLALWHRTCARALARRPGPRTSERVARHLLAADRRAEAVPHALDAARRRLDEGDYAAAAEQLAGWRAAVAILPGTDPRWGRGWLLESRLTRMQARTEEAERAAARALAAALRHGWISERAAALLEQGVLARHTGRVADSERLLRAAVQVVGDDTALRAACGEELGLTLLRQGERDRAAAALETARVAYAAVDDPLGLGRSLFGLARAHLQAGEADAARRRNEAARAAFQAGGARGAEATCRIMDGELARQAGDLEAAAEHYRAALKLFESIGAANATYARLNLGFTLLEADRFTEAWAPLEAALTELGAHGARVAQAAARAGLLPIAAASGDWQSFDTHRAALAALLESSDLSDVDTARLSEKGARQALKAGDAPRARQAAALAIELWTRMGHPDRAAAAEALVG